MKKSFILILSVLGLFVGLGADCGGQNPIPPEQPDASVDGGVEDDDNDDNCSDLGYEFGDPFNLY